APIKKFRRDVPPELEKVVSRALAKNKEERYREMEDLAEDLHKIRDKSGIERRSGFVLPSADTRRKFAWNYPAAALIILLLASGAAWYYWRNANLRWAEESVGKVEELAQNDKYFEAYDLALQIEEYLPQNPVIAQLMPTISDKFTVTTEPDGARVFLKRFQPDDKGNFPERQLIGTTPINDLRIARGQYVLAIEKDGYAPLERTISGTTNRLGTKVIRITPPLRVESKLVEAGKQPANMVPVKGGEYKLVTWSRPTESPVKLNDFFIDKYEVSNREYKEFINAGGYLKQEYWKFPFVKDGKTLTWEEAMREFKDRTALQAPRNWTSQNFPEGKAEHPVTDITWYEAAAYAAFRGKSLPTIHQWEKAARDGMRDFLVVTMPWGLFKPGEATDFRANFNGIGTTAVNSFEFGMSPYGCYNTAGNVSEWCQNKRGDGFITSGGSWADPVYLFGQYGSYPGFYSSNKLGFRCVLNLPDAVGDQGAMQFSEEDEIPVFSPPKEADFKAILSHYHYDKTPLEAEIVETKETDEWRREKITFNGAEGERVIAYLYLPKNYARPLQVIHFYPADDVWFGFRSLQDSMDLALSPFIKSGRAVFGVAVKGYVERRHPPNYKRPEPNTVEYRRQVINGAIDLRRGLDYLETRSDIDAGKIAMMSFSNGSPMMLGWIVSALDSRYRSMIITGIGARPNWAKWIAEANPLNFVSHIRHPKLIMNGRYDESTPLKTEAEPFFKLLPEPKRLMLYDGGHVPPIEIFVPAANAWFDETLGAVKRE
ncbi:MAG TPA: SUMF1/EgtB/PvdO family nonheme iron enzyme, partial [Pyrinomonadaceae bacterium]|nr:SUMF1/EgtB/PvdO family nonheme iron enzyme [Pyrinomonadaceae bacterium]